MGEQESWAFQPIMSPPLNSGREEHWRHFDNSANAVSFGFVATAILISMFLVMAIFERFLRPNSPGMPSSGGQSSGDLESQMGFNGKLGYPSPKMTVYSKEVSVLMPGENVPTFIAQPAPVSCPLDRIPWSLHRHNSPSNPVGNSNMDSNPTGGPT
ncbi:hypothetical protein Nepgr_017701 [Nepenthes gracilis]|uniref:Uncharacterized protein n=1 Tax=Nepenthes gracilis TaxID=150966 RepID=A0AAD3SPW4_NEPGR|nr:hypothetical protein Nepgr_017701 [Nepenthes gracilis]